MATDDFAVMLPIPPGETTDVLPNLLATADDMARESGAFLGRTRTHEIDHPIGVPITLPDGSEFVSPPMLRVLYRRDA